LRPRLIDGPVARLRIDTEFKLGVGQRQRVIDRVDTVQHSDARVDDGACLQIEVAGALRIENFKSAALALVAEKLDQFGK